MSDRSLRICLLTYRGNPTSGGQGIYVRLLSRELVALGHRVDVWSGPPYPELFPGVGLVKVPSLDLWVGADGKAGLLVRPRSAGSLARAILALLDDPARRAAMGEAGRRRVLSLFTWRRTAERTVEAYREAMDIFERRLRRGQGSGQRTLPPGYRLQKVS